ncbi:MAG: ABC transporter substrate-binding protein [Alphaproteobacteria bacterium]
MGIRMAGMTAALGASLLAAAPDASAQDKFVFGGLLPLTGAAAAFGPGMSAALELAVRDINAAGGVLGARAEVVFADDACDANVAAPALDRLVGQSAKAIMGTGCSGVTLALLDKIQSAKVAMCAGANTAPNLSTAPDGGYFFRTSYSQAMVGPVMAQLVLADGHTSVAVLGRGDSFGEGLATGVKNALEARGAKVTKFIIYDPAQTAFEAEIASVVATKPEAIVMVGRDERAQIFRLLIERGMGPAKIGWYTPGGMAADFYKNVDPGNPAVLKGLRQTAPAKAEDFVKRVAEVNPQVKEFLFAAEQYDCAVLMALAATAARSSTPATFKDHLVGLTRGDTRCTTYAECLKALGDGRKIAYVGPTGPTYMSDIGEPTIVRVQLMEVDDKGVARPTRMVEIGR